MPLNTLRSRQNGYHFTDAISKGIIFNENAWILNKISLKLVSTGVIDNTSVLVQVATRRQLLYELMMIRSSDALMRHPELTFKRAVTSCEILLAILNDVIRSKNISRNNCKPHIRKEVCISNCVIGTVSADGMVPLRYLQARWWLNSGPAYRWLGARL